MKQVGVMCLDSAYAFFALKLYLIRMPERLYLKTQNHLCTERKKKHNTRIEVEK